MRRSAGVVLMGLCVAALIAAVAQAALPLRGAIVPGRSMAGVRLGMSIAHVKRLWGAPNIHCGGGLDGRYYCGWYPRGAKHRNGIDQFVTIAAKNAHSPVVMIDDSGYRGFKTRQGIRVGSTKAQLIKAYGSSALLPGHVGGAPMLGLKRVAGGRTVWTWFKFSALDRRTIIDIILTPRHSAPL